MAVLYCWNVDCQTDGLQSVWSADIPPSTPPNVCPVDAGHTMNAVPSPVAVDMAPSTLKINDGAGRVFEITVDQNGALSANQIYGAPPA